MISISNAQVALSLFPTSTGSIDYASLYSGSSSSSGGAYDASTVHVAISQAEKNEAKQLAQVAKDPIVQRELDRYERVAAKAKSIDDILDDPVARTVLLKANGLGDQVDNIGLARKALMSDPGDPDSLARKLSSVNGAWLTFAQNYNLAENGLDRLYPQMNGVAGKWNVTIQREGKALEAELEITKYDRTTWQATVDGKPVGIQVSAAGEVTIDMLWEDDADDLHTTRLTGTLGKAGLTGRQIEDGYDTNSWSAEPYWAGAVNEVRENYIAEKRLDMLDQQLPGLGTALLFKQTASTFTDPIKILGSKLGREVVTTALGIPKEIAIQSLFAQEKAITSRLKISNLQNPDFVDKFAQRYLLAYNGVLGGISV